MACQFENTLHYSSPANGSRGIVRTGMLVPESVELFVCPFACGRHGSISAVKQNLKHRLFYLYVEQADIINGYDDLIVPAVEELLETLEERPKVVLIFVSCLDDLIGTDHEALWEKLTEQFPDIEFRNCHMNPISKGGKTPPAVSVQNNIYSLLKVTEQKDMGINCIGTFAPVDEASELHAFIRSLGYENLRHISQYDTFAGYQEMAKSKCNLVLTSQGKQAAEQMKEKHGTPFVFLPVSYRMEEIERRYAQFAQAIAPKQQQAFDFVAHKEAAESAIARARKAVGDTPVIVDSSSVACPFGLARALIEYGFRVVRVQAPECTGIDKKDYEWVQQEHPEIEIVQSQHHKSVLRENQIAESIAVGVDGAYLAGSKYVADLFEDEGMYGYYGVTCLMEKLEHALEKEVDLENMIHEYGLVV